MAFPFFSGQSNQVVGDSDAKKWYAAFIIEKTKAYFSSQDLEPHSVYFHGRFFFSAELKLTKLYCSIIIYKTCPFKGSEGDILRNFLIYTFF